MRKTGKLPSHDHWPDYALEYGTDRVEMHWTPSPRASGSPLVDDLIATGGTAFAAVHCSRQVGADVIGACFPH